MNLFTPSLNLAEELDAIKRQLSHLQAQSGSGKMFFGEALQTDISSHTYVQGPHRMDCDDGFPNTFNLLVPNSIKKLIQVSIRVKLRPIRQVIITGEPTDPGEFIDIVTTHQHKWADYVDDSPPALTEREFDTVRGNALPNPSFAGGIALKTEFGEDLYTGQPEAESSSGIVAASGEHIHTSLVEFSETGAPTQVRITIDGVDRSAALSGPWDADFTVEISPYLRDAIYRPIYGDHEIILSTETPGALEAVIDFYVVTKPVQL